MQNSSGSRFALILVRYLFFWAVGIALVTGTSLAASTTDVEHDLNIPRTSLNAALTEFTRQTGWPTESAVALPDSTWVGPLKGTYTAAAALAQLLAGSGFEFKQKEQSFSLSPQTARPAAPKKPPPRPSPPAPLQSDEVIVLARRRLQAQEPNPSRDIAFGEQDIEWQSPSQIGNMLSNSSQQPFAMNRRANGAQFAELRGLGIDATSVTINGRRAPPTIGETTGSFDLGLVPVTAVAGMKIALEPTELQIGPPAGGGNVDIELKKLPHPIVELQYGDADGGSEERRLGMGTGIETERFTGSIVWEHFDRDPLYGDARDRWRNQDFRRFGGRDYRVSSDRASLNSYYTAMPEIDQNSLVALAELELTERTSLFGELLFTDRDVMQQFSPPVVSQMLPATNPFNPSGRPIPIDTFFSQEPARQRGTQSEWWRGVAGFKSQWQSWHLELAAVGTRDDVLVISSHDLNQQRLSEALAESDPGRALNVLDPAFPGNREVLDHLRAPPSDIHFQSKTSTVTATARGTFDIGERDISASIGGEWEQSDILVGAWLPMRRTVQSGFAQFEVPLTQQTTLNLGSRLDRVSDVGLLWSPQLAFEWRPSESLTAYASAGSSERAASPVDLFQPISIVPTSAFDPVRQQANKVDVVMGGNPDLEPVSSRTFAMGLLWEPDAPLLKKLGAKYWRIHLDDRITFPAISYLLSNEGLYQDRIVRDASGTLQLIDMRRINGGPLDTSGVDLETLLSFDSKLGKITSKLDITFVDKYSSNEMRGLPRVERAGIANSYGTIPRWRVIGSLAVERAFGTVVTTVRHMPAYQDAYVVPNGRTIESQTLLDLTIVLDLGQVVAGFAPLKHWKATFGVENLLDDPPPFADVGMSSGFDPSQGDLRQRYVFFKLSREF
ncbi:TonB-dependent receptor domain-containing protein [Steroidobacter flavus]|uniref:TonB-dependent receptor domain-containing protein n=1 Tax=Steroidobacter flavus TaxID=1842136 RepID=A0ABV8SLS7_9GAMM